jgi:hypothetical protein
MTQKSRMNKKKEGMGKKTAKGSWQLTVRNQKQSNVNAFPKYLLKFTRFNNH